MSLWITESSVHLMAEKYSNCDILFLIVCFFYSVCLCVTIFLLYSLFEISILLPIFTVVNFLVIVCILRLYGHR